MKRWDYPPWLKGKWFESLRFKKIKHTYVVMGKKEK